MKGRIRTIALVAAALLVLCIVIGALSPSTTPSATATPAPIATAPQRAATVPQPTNTPRPAPTATAAPVMATVGQMAESGGISFGVASVQKAAKVGIWEAKAGNTFLVTEVVIQNVSRDTTPYNPLYCKVKDADGFEYTMTFGGADPALKSGDLVKGDKVRGMVTFEVPATAKGFVMSYEPLVILGGYKAIKVDLGQ